MVLIPLTQNGYYRAERSLRRHVWQMLQELLRSVYQHPRTERVNPRVRTGLLVISVTGGNTQRRVAVREYEVKPLK